MSHRFKHEDSGRQGGFECCDFLEFNGQIEFSMTIPKDNDDEYLHSYMTLKDAARLRDWLNEALMGYVIPVVSNQ